MRDNITVRYVTLAVDHLVSKTPITNADKKIIDVDGDGKVSTEDIISLARHFLTLTEKR